MGIVSMYIAIKKYPPYMKKATVRTTDPIIKRNTIIANNIALSFSASTICEHFTKLFLKLG